MSPGDCDYFTTLCQGDNDNLGDKPQEAEHKVNMQHSVTLLLTHQEIQSYSQSFQEKNYQQT